jgi:hypothetical protein
MCWIPDKQEWAAKRLNFALAMQRLRRTSDNIIFTDEAMFKCFQTHTDGQWCLPGMEPEPLPRKRFCPGIHVYGAIARGFCLLYNFSLLKEPVNSDSEDSVLDLADAVLRRIPQEVKPEPKKKKKSVNSEAFCTLLRNVAPSFHALATDTGRKFYVMLDNASVHIHFPFRRKIREKKIASKSKNM